MTDNTKDLELELSLDDEDLDDFNRELIEEYLNGEADKLATKTLRMLYKIRKVKPYINKLFRELARAKDTESIACMLENKIMKGGD